MLLHTNHFVRGNCFLHGRGILNLSITIFNYAFFQ